MPIFRFQSTTRPPFRFAVTRHAAGITRPAGWYPANALFGISPRIVGARRKVYAPARLCRAAAHAMRAEHRCNRTTLQWNVTAGRRRTLATGCRHQTDSYRWVISVLGGVLPSMPSLNNKTEQRFQVVNNRTLKTTKQYILANKVNKLDAIWNASNWACVRQTIVKERAELLELAFHFAPGH